MGKVIKSAENKATSCSRFERDTLEHFVRLASGDEGDRVDPAAILAGLQAEAEQMREEAREQGLQEGLAEGREAAQQEGAAAIQALASAAAAIQQSHDEYVSGLEPEFLRLIRYIAERILDREIRGDLDVVRSTIRAALKNVLEREHIDLHLNPEDIKGLEDEGIDLIAELSKFDQLEIVPDETVGRGGCAVESRTLSVDARLDTQLQRIFDALTD